MGLILELICIALQVYILVLFARAILSWFPLEPGTTFYKVGEVLVRMTEPALAPLRRIVPRTGMLDLSFLVLMLILVILISVLCGSVGFSVVGPSGTAWLRCAHGNFAPRTA